MALSVALVLRRSGAQQLSRPAAIEKWLKVEDARIDFPFDTPTVVRLTEYAVPLRYDELLDAIPLDREAAVKLVSEVGGWATNVLDGFGE